MAVTGASCVNWSAKEVEEDRQKNFQRVGRGHFDESIHLTLYPGRELIVLYSCFSRVIKPTEKEQKTRCAYRRHCWGAWTPQARNCFSREYGSGWSHALWLSVWIKWWDYCTMEGYRAVKSDSSVGTCKITSSNALQCFNGYWKEVFLRCLQIDVSFIVLLFCWASMYCHLTEWKEKF